MGTLLRLGPWRVMIYTNDHGPSHVHVVGPDGRAKIALNCPRGPVTPLDIRGIDGGTVRRIVVLIERDLEVLCATWENIHGNT